MRFEILDLTGQTVVDTVEGEYARVQALYPGRWREVASTPLPPLPLPRHCTKLAFRNRFTQAEKVALELAGLDVPLGTPTQRQQAAAVRASQADVQSASYIDLDRQDTRNGVLGLEAAGLLAVGRALEVLDTPLTPLETFKE
jgi:hypothetical protein